MNNSNKDKIPSPEEKFSSQELRVASNSSRFTTVQEAVGQAEISVEKLLSEWDNICALNDYLESGDWQADFEADERGEISRAVPRAVLSEDGLYNLLDRLQDLLGQMATLASFVRVS